MTGVNKTLYIPLYGKAYVSRKGIILSDKKAEEIWSAAGKDIPLKGKSKSKWLAYYMGMRSAVFDGWLRERMSAQPDAVVLHIGCGLDSRILRVGAQGHLWFDMDFADVIEERRQWYSEDECYHMLAGDARCSDWLAQLPEGGELIAVIEGVSMYLTEDELRGLLSRLSSRFNSVSLLMDCYTSFAAKASRYKNPINDVGVTQVYGVDDPAALSDGTGLSFVKEHEITPQTMINELQGMEKAIFKRVFGGSFSKKMYRLYELGK